MRLRGLKRNNGYSLSAVYISALLLCLAPTPLLAFSGYIHIFEMKDSLGNDLDPDDFTKARLTHTFKVTVDIDPGEGGTKASYRLEQAPRNDAPSHPTHQQVNGPLKVKTVLLKKSTNSRPEEKTSTANDAKKPKQKTTLTKTVFSKKNPSQTASSQSRTCTHSLEGLPPLYNLDETDTQPITVEFEQIQGTNSYHLTLEGFPNFSFSTGLRWGFSSRPDTLMNTWFSLERRFSRYGVLKNGVQVSLFSEEEINTGTAMQSMLWSAGGFNEIVIGLTCEFQIQLVFAGEEGTGQYSMIGVHASQVLPQQDAASPSQSATNLFLQFVPENHFGSTAITAGGHLTHQPAEADVDGEWDTNEPVTPLTRSSSRGSSRSRHIDPNAEVSLSEASGRSTPNSQPPSVHDGSPVTPLSQSTPPAAANYHSPSSHPRSWSVSQQVPRLSSSSSSGNFQTSRSWGSRVSPSQSPHQPLPVSGTPPRGRSGSSGPYQQINIAGLNPVSSGAYQTVNRQGTSARRFVIADEQPEINQMTGQPVTGQSRSYQNVSPPNRQQPKPGSRQRADYQNVLDLPPPPVPPRLNPPEPLLRGGASLQEREAYASRERSRMQKYMEEQRRFDLETGNLNPEEDPEEDDSEYTHMDPQRKEWFLNRRDHFGDGGGAAGAAFGFVSF